MKNSVFLVLMLSLVSAPVMAAEVYKWTDAQGRTRYTDIPPPSNVPYVTLSGKKSPQPATAAPEAPGEFTPPGEPPVKPAAPAKPVSSPAAPKSLADRELEEAKKKIAAAEEKKKKAEMEAEQKLRDKNCASAKSNLLQLKEGGRIYSTNEKGEREYLNDADRASKIAQAEKDVEEWCKPQ